MAAHHASELGRSAGIVRGWMGRVQDGVVPAEQGGSGFSRAGTAGAPQHGFCFCAVGVGLTAGQRCQMLRHMARDSLPGHRDVTILQRAAITTRQ